MSERLLAILAHDFRSIEEVLRLPEVARPLAGEANALERMYFGGTHLDAEGWSAGGTPEQDWAEHRCVWMDGPMGIGVGARCMMLQPSAKWNWVRGQPAVLAAAASFFERAAKALGAAWYLGTHGGDAWNDVTEGLSVVEIEEKLDARGYRRVATPGDLYSSSPAEVPDYKYDVYCSFWSVRRKLDPRTHGFIAEKGKTLHRLRDQFCQHLPTSLNARVVSGVPAGGAGELAAGFAVGVGGSSWTAARA